MNQRRSYIEIIAEMLKIGENGAGKTKIMYAANMSYYQLNKYLGLLLDRGLINELTPVNHHFNYQVTEKGMKLLSSIGDVLGALESEEEIRN